MSPRIFFFRYITHIGSGSVEITWFKKNTDPFTFAT